LADRVGAEINGLKLSLKLYNESELRVGHQQLVAEAPSWDDVGPEECDMNKKTETVSTEYMGLWFEIPLVVSCHQERTIHKPNFIN